VLTPAMPSVRATRGAMVGLATIIVAICFLRPAIAQARSAEQQLAVDIFKELIEINTVTATGDTQRAAEAMALRLRAAGFSAEDAQVLSPAPRKGNLVARLRGTGEQKPMLLLAHLDVVAARREDWSMDPFTLIEQDGYFYGRGTSDDKAMAAAFVANLIGYRQEGYRPQRDIIVVLETDEEILDRHVMGIQWLLMNHRHLIEAEFALNEGGGVGMRGGKAVRNSIQTSEKFIINFRLEVQDRGGHSSVPRKDNPIYRLAEGLVRLSKFNFPIKLNETTRAFFSRAADQENEQLAAEMRSVAAVSSDLEALSVVRLSSIPFYNAQLRTTCVATMLEGGHAGNALPQLASAHVNCRVLPGEAAAEVRDTLVRVLADEHIVVTQLGEPVLSAPSVLHQDVMQAIEKVTAELWPGVPVVPIMSTGGTDGSHLRNAGIPTYGTSGIASEEIRAHGRDERVLVKSFLDANQYLYRLVKLLAGGQ
jgi:acetylornithine deacetylase/succinyl-diaminopimelate desuccinylase-like protein